MELQEVEGVIPIRFSIMDVGMSLSLHLNVRAQPSFRTVPASTTLELTSSELVRSLVQFSVSDD
jgi:hypothetical protein